MADSVSTRLLRGGSDFGRHPRPRDCQHTPSGIFLGEREGTTGLLAGCGLRAGGDDGCFCLRVVVGSSSSVLDPFFSCLIAADCADDDDSSSVRTPCCCPGSALRIRNALISSGSFRSSQLRPRTGSPVTQSWFQHTLEVYFALHTSHVSSLLALYLTGYFIHLRCHGQPHGQTRRGPCG